MDTVECRVFTTGLYMPIARERLIFRPSAYALILREGRILLMRMRRTGRYALPGGGIELGETVEQGLKREVREEAGIEIALGRFAHFHEDFFYYDPGDLAFHSFMFYYFCDPLTLDLAGDDEVDDDEVEQPGWVALAGLQAGDFHTHGEITVRLLNSAG